MTRLRILASGLASLLVIGAVVLLLSSCGLGGAEGQAAPPSSTKTTSTLATPTASTVPVEVDELSTFKSKDPFRQQNLPATSTTASSGDTTTTASGGTTTTTVAGGSTTTTTSAGGTTTTSNPSNVTTPIHSLKVLSIDEVNGEPAVTFEVDGVIYEDKRVGDVVSTSWGEIEVVAIDADAQTVTFLHGSETRTLTVGEEFLK